MDQSYISYLNSLVKSFSVYFSASALMPGILLNLASAGIFFSSKNLNKTSMGHLYGLLSLVDALSLSCDVFLIQFLPLIDSKLSIQRTSDLTCKLFYFINRTVVFVSSWLQMYISLDRWISVRFPRRFQTLNSPWTINIIFLVLVVALCLVSSENLFYSLTPTVRTSVTTLYNQTVNGSNNATVIVTKSTTSYGCSASDELLFAAQIISAAFRTWIPLVFLLIINILTIRILAQSRRRVTGSNEKAYSNRERQFTYTVMALNGIFFVLNFPLSVYWVLDSIFDFFNVPASSLFLSSLNLYYTISLSAAYFYHSITFFINLAFNSLFRREIVRLLYRAARRPMPETTAYPAELTRSVRRPELKS